MCDFALFSINGSSNGAQPTSRHASHPQVDEFANPQTPYCTLLLYMV